MKKRIAILLAALMVVALPVTVAAEMTTCTVMVDPVAALPGQTLMVAVRIEDNPGFTNYAIALDYDREHLTLKSIEAPADSAVNAESGLVVSAFAGPEKEDGILFTATFEIAEDFAGETVITPVVRYIRNNEAVFEIFEEIHAAVKPGTVAAVLWGDLTGDGVVEYNDVMLAYKAFLGDAELTPEQLAAVDESGNGTVEEAEYQAIYQIYIGGSV